MSVNHSYAQEILSLEEQLNSLMSKKNEGDLSVLCFKFVILMRLTAFTLVAAGRRRFLLIPKWFMCSMYHFAYNVDYFCVFTVEVLIFS